MKPLKTTVAHSLALSLLLFGAGLAHAQGPAQTTGSTDIYNTDFQKAFASARAGSGTPAVQANGSTDIYTADFQRLYASQATAATARQPEQVASGSTNIYTTDFQKLFM